MSQTAWEKMIKALLGDDSPCKVCAVQVMCAKSFSSRKGGGCPDLRKQLEKKLDNMDMDKK